MQHTRMDLLLCCFIQGLHFIVHVIASPHAYISDTKKRSMYLHTLEIGIAWSSSQDRRTSDVSKFRFSLLVNVY